MRFATWNVRSLYRAGLLTAAAAAARELARYKLDLVGVEEARWDKGGTVRAGDYIFFSVEKETKINWEQVLFSYAIVSAVTRVVFFIYFFRQDSPLCSFLCTV
jgi:hypothetical protein